MMQKIYRSSQNKYAVIFGAAATGLFIYLATKGGSGLIPASLFAALLLICTWRAAVVGIHIVPGGVKVVSSFKTTRLSWEEIDRFTLAPRGPYPLTGHVILRDGRDIWCVGLDAGRRPTAWSRKQAEEPIAQLNSLLEGHRNSQPSNQPPTTPV